MKEYLYHTFNEDDFNLVSVADELPLWSAPFGLKLLELINLKPNINVLDIGCGSGFPLIEIAQRLGETSNAVGLDPWQRAVERTELKIKTYGLKNVTIINGVAEQMPFEDNMFDLVISNNGLNNVKDMRLAFSECSRVSKPGAQFIFSFNLENTMMEFYNVFESVMAGRGMTSEIKAMKNQIYEKRKPLEEVKSLLHDAGYDIRKIVEDSFALRYLNAETMFNHSFIKYWFLGGWKKILKPEEMEIVFEDIEKKMDLLAAEKGYVSLSIPFVVVDCLKK